jgi:hypothetical protein
LQVALLGSSVAKFNGQAVFFQFNQGHVHDMESLSFAASCRFLG